MKNQTLSALLLIMALMPCTLLAQQSDYLQQTSKADALFMEQDYAASLEGYRQVITQLEKAGLQADSLYSSSWNMVGRCHFRMQNYGEATAAAKRATELYAAQQGDTTLVYALMLDNLSIYCMNADRMEEAEQYSAKALQIYYRLLPNNVDMRATLIHGAEIKALLKKYDEAITLHQHALNIIAEIEGDHTSDYVNELAYLAKYYNDAGQKERASEVEAQVSRLKEEIENGYVPPLTHFDSAEKCLEHRVDAYYCSRYYLKHYLSADRMNEAAQYIMNWTMATDELTVIIGEPETKWMADQKNSVYLIAYLAGTAMYALENPDNKNSQEQYKEGIIAMLNYYTANREITGEVPAYEDYLKLYAKDKKDLFARIEKDYKAFNKAVKKNETQMVSTRN